MKSNVFFLFFIVFLIIIMLAVSFSLRIKNQSDDPEKVVESLYKAIEFAKQKGVYKCCINPDCTMCYLGHWEYFEKGTCYCDDKIKQGKFDEVCPECKSGIEKGLCSSTVDKDCILDENTYGGKK